MAVGAVDFMVRHVHLVHEDVIVDAGKIVLSVVAHAAAFSGNLAVALDDIHMAVVAVDALLVCQFVTELDAAAEIEFFHGNRVAACAGSQPFVEGRIFEVAEVARGRRNRHVLPLHHLTVATRAAKLLSSSQFIQMRSMIEGNAVELDSSRQQSRFMAPRTEAAGVGISAAGRGPSLLVMYLASCTNPSIFPRTFSRTPVRNGT